MAGVTLLAVMIASAFLMPLAFMVATAFKDPSLLTTVGAPLYPAVPETFEYDGADHDVYDVPTEDGAIHAWALLKRVARTRPSSTRPTPRPARSRGSVAGARFSGTGPST